MEVKFARNVYDEMRIDDFEKDMEFKKKFYWLLARYFLADEPENRPPQGYESKDATEKLSEFIKAEAQPMPLADDDRGRTLYEIDGNKFWFYEDGRLSATFFNTAMDEMFEAIGWYKDAISGWERK